MAHSQQPAFKGAALVTLILMFAPLATCALGYLLMLLLQCQGVHELKCSGGDTGGLVVMLLYSPFLLFVTIPIGVLVLVILQLLARAGGRSGAARDAVPEPLPPQRASMPAHAPLTRVRLDETWFDRLALNDIERQGSDPSSPAWPCAIDLAGRVLFTALQNPATPVTAKPAEYLLAIGKDIIVFAMDESRARIVPTGASHKYETEALHQWAREGIAALAGARP